MNGKTLKQHARIYTGALARLPLCHAASKRALPLTQPDETNCGNCRRSTFLPVAILRATA